MLINIISVKYLIENHIHFFFFYSFHLNLIKQHITNNNNKIFKKEKKYNTKL